MLKKFFVLSLILVNTSCAEAGLMLFTGGTGSSTKNSHYKYKCEKVGKCEERTVEDAQKKETYDNQTN
jgi:hypothetical protein